LPATVEGIEDAYSPSNIPSRQTLDRKTGYNWIAVATKEDG